MLASLNLPEVYADSPIACLMMAISSVKYSALIPLLKQWYQRRVLTTATPLAVTEKEGAISYMNLLDGLIVELIYQGVDKFFTRLDVSWKVYWRGISSN
ncbi:UNVERIFIED_CONTAM: hypothetical protein ABID98_003819 [Brevibacillus sp. OAP136]